MAEKRKIKWSKVVLALSLGLNLAVVGVVAGAWWNGPDRSERGQPRPAWSNGPFGRALTDADRKSLAQEFRSEKGVGKRMRGHRAEMRKNASEITKILRAEPFDPAALEAIFVRMRDLGRQQIDAGNEALMNRLVAMSPEERSDFADRFEKTIKRPRRHKN